MTRQGLISTIAAGLLGAGAALGVTACGEDRGSVEVQGATGTVGTGTVGTTPATGTTGTTP